MSTEVYVRHCCEWPWTWWASLSESDQAQWFGAVGSMLAVMVAVGVFAYDKLSSRCQERAARDIRRQYQAIALAPMLSSALQTLRDIQSSLPWAPPSKNIPQLDEMQKAIVDPAAFGPEIAADLLTFIAKARHIEHVLKRDEGVAVLLPLIVDADKVGARIIRSMRALAMLDGEIPDSDGSR